MLTSIAVRLPARQLAVKSLRPQVLGFRRTYSSDTEHDVVVIGTSPLSPGEAIAKQAQAVDRAATLLPSRLRRRASRQVAPSNGSMELTKPDCLYREARGIGRNMLERRMYPFKVAPQQLAHLPPDPA